MISTRTIGRMKTSALLTLLMYYERTNNRLGASLVKRELHERELEANS